MLRRRFALPHTASSNGAHIFIVTQEQVLDALASEVKSAQRSQAQNGR